MQLDVFVSPLSKPKCHFLIIQGTFFYRTTVHKNNSKHARNTPRKAKSAKWCEISHFIESLEIRARQTSVRLGDATFRTGNFASQSGKKKI